MEHSEGFKSVESKIKSLEQQLSLCSKTIKDFEQSGKDAEKEIEEHFARCMNSLAARKVVLLEEVAQKIANQRMISSTPFHSFLLRSSFTPFHSPPTVVNDYFLMCDCNRKDH
jgi:hypothetical protein